MNKFTIYGDDVSGNCLKVKYVADFLRLEYEWVPIDILKNESRTSSFLALNPMGQVPLVKFGDGRKLAQSNAIIQYLSEGSSLYSEDRFTRAVINSILFWEQYSHEPYIAVCRFQMRYLGKSKEERENWRVERGEAALNFMDDTLTNQDWFVGSQMTIADIALIAYTRLAHEGGFTLDHRPAVKNWITRVEQQLFSGS